jgi:hypothetical protein
MENRAVWKYTWINMFVVVVGTQFYMQVVYIHSANWFEDWVLWLGEGHSVVRFRS